MDRYLEGFTAGQAVSMAAARRLLDRATGKGFLVGIAFGVVVAWFFFGGAR